MTTNFEVPSTLVGFWKIVVIAVLSGVLCACGFHLRNAVELPESMKLVYAEGFLPGSPFLTYLGQKLQRANGELTQSRQDAGVVLKAVSEQFLRREVSLSQTGKTNSYELSYILTYDLQDPAGEVILGQQTISVVREYFNPQVDVIGKSEEEGVIRKEMYREAVKNLLRRAEVALQGRAPARRKKPK